MRRIIHIDMDAFYASVEERDDPSLRGRPVAVGGDKVRGVVMTANYVARRFGVRSAMPSALALRRCPELVFVRPRFDVYKAISAEVHTIFERFTDQVEGLSLDEAYLDVTLASVDVAEAIMIAQLLKEAIASETSLTASAGVGSNKFLAKLASEMDKPNGLRVILAEDAPSLLAALPIERLYGVGPATARRLRAAGIGSGADLQALSEAETVRRLGRQGRHFWRLARGIDERPVQPQRRRKSLSTETTFAVDLTAPKALDEAIEALAQELARRLLQSGFRATTVTLKIKYRDFRLTARQTTLREPPNGPDALAAAARALLHRAPLAAPIRLLGLGVGGTAYSAEQLNLPLGPVPTHGGPVAHDLAGGKAQG